MQGCLCFVGMFACCASDASGEDPKPQFVLGAPVATTNPPVVGLACLLGKNEVLIQNINGLSVVDLASGKMLASAKLEPFPDSVAVRLPRHAAFSTNSGFLSVANDGKTAYSYDAMGVYSYELPLGDAPKSRVANRAKTIVPMLGIAHVGKFDFAFGVNSRGELFECRSTPGEADPRVGMVKTKVTVQG